MLAEDRARPYLTEQVVLDRARAGDSEAFDRLFREHKDGVYSCLWHLLDGEAEVVEEAVGSVFLNAYRSLARFRGDSAFSTWLYRIAVNEAHARLREKRRRKLLSWLSMHEPKTVNECHSRLDDPAERLLRTEDELSLHRAVNSLPEPYRTPVVLRYIGGMPAPEISAALGRPAGTVRYQLSRALQILRERLGSDWTK